MGMGKYDNAPYTRGGREGAGAEVDCECIMETGGVRDGSGRRGARQAGKEDEGAGAIVAMLNSDWASSGKRYREIQDRDHPATQRPSDGCSEHARAREPHRC